MRGGVGIVVGAVCLGGGGASSLTGGEALSENVKSTAARLVIYRSSPMGLALQPNYLVDRVVGGSQPAGFLVCELSPGSHEVAVVNMPLSSNPFGHGSEKVRVDLRAGSTTYLFPEPQMGLLTPGQITLIQVTEGQGRSDVTSLHQDSGACRA